MFGVGGFQSLNHCVVSVCLNCGKLQNLCYGYNSAFSQELGLSIQCNFFYAFMKLIWVLGQSLVLSLSL